MRRIYLKGFNGMLAITTGIIPFGAVMGSVAAEAKLTFAQTMGMNFIVFAGAAQLAAVDLMTHGATIFVVVATGTIINLRFILYSAAMSPVVQKENIFVKMISAYLLTDQSYTVMIAHEHTLKSNREKLIFYAGAATCMLIAWHGSVIGGHIFGNFAPPTLALDYAVPLSFVTLAIPTLKNRKYVYVTMFSSVAAILLKPLPYNLGLIVTAAFAMILAAFLTRKKALR